MTIQLHLGDCLDILPTLPAQSVNAIITDLPYGTTACKWDEIIPFAPMWAEVKRILKPRGVFVTTASQPFTSKLVMSNLEWFRYCWVWNKSKATGFLDANRKPLKAHEDVIVFSRGSAVYNPQMIKTRIHRNGGKNRGKAHEQMHGKFEDFVTISDSNYPQSVISFTHETDIDHPTQKPVALYTYLILTYTNPGDTVLDFTAGSGTTGVSCIDTGRDFIGIEKDAVYFAIMQKRIAAAQQQPRLAGI